MGSQSSIRDGDILGGRGRGIEASREGQRQVSVRDEDILVGRGRDIEASRERQHVEVKVKGPNGVMGYVEEHQVVSKKVSYKFEIDCCFISLLIVGITYPAICIVLVPCSVTALSGDLAGDSRGD